MSVYALIIAAAFLAMLLTGVFAMIGSRGPWGSLWTIFLVLFLSVWLAGVHLGTIGPVYSGVAWMPLVVAGVLVGVCLMVVAPARTARRREGDQKLQQWIIGDGNGPSKGSALPGTTAGKFFWILVMLLVAVIIAGFV